MTGPHLSINPAAQVDPSLAHLLPSADVQSSIRFVKVAEGHTWVEGPSYLKHADAFVFSDIPKSEQWAVDRKTGHTRLARWGTGLTNGTFTSPRLSAIAAESGAKLGRERKWDVILCCEHAGRRISAATYEVVPDNQGGQRSDHIEAVEKKDGLGGLQMLELELIRPGIASILSKILVDNYQGLPFNSPNDVIELPDGSVLFTDPTYGCYPSSVEGHGFMPAQPETAVYRFHLSDPQGTLEKVVIGMLMPNGLTFVAPSTLVVADSGGCLPAHLDPKEVDKVEASVGEYSGKWGDISGTAKILMDALNGIPDGIRHDPLGRIYSSTFNGVDVYAPLCASGAEPTHLFTLNIPTMTANFCFGGPDMDELCICNNHDVWLVKGLGIKGCA